MLPATGDSRQLEDNTVIYLATTADKASKPRHYEGERGVTQKSELHSLLQEPEDNSAIGTFYLRAA